MPLSDFFPDHRSQLESVYEKHKSADGDNDDMKDTLRWERMNENAQPSSDARMNFIYNELVNVDGGSVSHPKLKEELDHRMRIDKVFQTVYLPYIQNLRRSKKNREMKDELVLPQYLDC